MKLSMSLKWYRRRRLMPQKTLTNVKIGWTKPTEERAHLNIKSCSSVAIVLMFAMKRYKWSLRRAYDYVTAVRRKEVVMNENFRSQLLTFERDTLELACNSVHEWAGAALPV